MKDSKNELIVKTVSHDSGARTTVGRREKRTSLISFFYQTLLILCALIRKGCPLAVFIGGVCHSHVVQNLRARGTTERESLTNREGNKEPVRSCGPNTETKIE